MVMLAVIHFSLKLILLNSPIPPEPPISLHCPDAFLPMATTMAKTNLHLGSGKALEKVRESLILFSPKKLEILKESMMWVKKPRHLLRRISGG